MPNLNQRLTHQNIIGDFLSIAILLIVSLTMYSWVLGDGTYFYVDDWGWLNRAVFTPWRDYLSWWTALPAALFMDRPIAGMAIHGLYSVSNLNHFGFSIATLGIHVLNSILIYFIGKKVLGFRFDGFIASTFFAINPYISYPVWWVATIHDSLALLFCLSSFLTFISNKRYSIYLACFFYYLATRSKEAALPFPLILIAYEILFGNSDHKIFWSTERYKAILKKISPIIITFLFLISFYIFYYLRAKFTEQNFGPYAPKFTIYTITEGINYYIQLVFFNALAAYKALLLCAALLTTSLILKDSKATFFLIAFLLACSPVLVLGTQRVPYYAYIPAPWLYLFLAASYSAIRIKLASKIGGKLSYFINFFALLALIFFGIHIFKTENISKPTLAIMGESKKAMISLTNIVPKVKEGTNFVILGVPHGPLTFFAYAPCHAIKVLYKVRDITCAIQKDDITLLDEYRNLNSPKILLNYNNGDVIPLEKNGL